MEHRTISDRAASGETMHLDGAFEGLRLRQVQARHAFRYPAKDLVGHRSAVSSQFGGIDSNLATASNQEDFITLVGSRNASYVDQRQIHRDGSDDRRI